MMVDPNSAKFISSLVKSLQMFCHGYMEFEDNIEIIGHINLRIDNRQKLDYIVNEQVSKQGQESTCFQSNSYHSLPPKSHERDQQAGSRCEDLPLDSSMAVLAGTRVQVDLSGPSPVTRSTFSSYPDGFLSPMGNSQGSDSQAQSLDTEQASASSGLKELLWAAQNQVVNHSHTSEKSSKQTGVVDSARAESSMSMAVSSDGDGQQQSVARLLQDIVIKAEPGSFSSPEKQASEDDMNNSSSSADEIPLHFLGLKTDPALPESADNVELEGHIIPKRPCSDSWQYNHRKKQRLQGLKQYQDRDGGERPERMMGPPCQSSLCRKSKTRGCGFITHDERSHLFNHFWSIRTWKERRSYVKSCVVGLPVKHRQSEPPEGSRRHNSFVYHFGINGLAVNVCKTMFCNTLGLSARTVGAWNSEDSGCGIAWDGAAFANPQQTNSPESGAVSVL